VIVRRKEECQYAGKQLHNEAFGTTQLRLPTTEAWLEHSVQLGLQIPNRGYAINHTLWTLPRFTSSTLSYTRSSGLSILSCGYSMSRSVNLIMTDLTS
jgi:hypothetical protein